MVPHHLAHLRQVLLVNSASEHEDFAMTCLETAPLFAPWHVSSRLAHHSRNSTLHYIQPAYLSLLAIAQNKGFLPMLSHLLQQRHSFVSAGPY